MHFRERAWMATHCFVGISKSGIPVRGREKTVYWCMPFLPCSLSFLYYFLGMAIFARPVGTQPGTTLMGRILPDPIKNRVGFGFKKKKTQSGFELGLGFFQNPVRTRTRPNLVIYIYIYIYEWKHKRAPQRQFQFTKVVT